MTDNEKPAPAATGDGPSNAVQLAGEQSEATEKLAFKLGPDVRVIPKNPRESIRIQMADFRGARFLDVRTWADTGDGQLRPTRQGVTVPLAWITVFVDAVAHVGREARPDGA